MTKPTLIKIDKSLSLPTQKGDVKTWADLKGSASALAIVEAAVQHEGLTLVICADNELVDRIEEEIGFYGAELEVPLLHFPGWEILPYDTFSPHQDIISQRI